MEVATKEIDLTNVRTEMKVFKESYNHLVALTRSGIATLDKALKNMIARQEAKKLAEGQTKQKASQAVAGFFEFAMERGTAFAEHNAGSGVPKDVLDEPMVRS